MQRGPNRKTMGLWGQIHTHSNHNSNHLPAEFLKTRHNTRACFLFSKLDVKTPPTSLGGCTKWAPNPENTGWWLVACVITDSSPPAWRSGTPFLLRVFSCVLKFQALQTLGDARRRGKEALGWVLFLDAAVESIQFDFTLVPSHSIFPKLSPK